MDSWTDSEYEDETKRRPHTINNLSPVIEEDNDSIESDAETAGSNTETDDHIRPASKRASETIPPGIFSPEFRNNQTYKPIIYITTRTTYFKFNIEY